MTKNPLEPSVAKIGAPLKLNDEKRGTILGALAAGASRRYAAKLVGVSHATIGNEIERNEDFAEKIAIAEAQCYLHHVKAVKAASLEDWRAAAWFLERKFREEFGKAEVVEHTGGTEIIVRMVDDFFDNGPAIEHVKPETQIEDAEYEVRDVEDDGEG